MTYDFHFAYLLFFCIGCCSATAFFVYKRFMITEQGQLAQLSDRGYLAMSLLLCIVGSLVCMNFVDHRKLSTLRTTVGLCIIGIGFVVGSRATANLFAKIIGIS